VSAGLAIRSKGDPYFALAQLNLAGMTDPNAPFESGSFPGHTFIMEVQFRLESLPVAFASQDEVHILFSYLQMGLFDTDLAWIGVTPSGRVAVGAMNGPVLQTAVGLLVPSKLWNAAQMQASNNGAGAETVTLHYVHGFTPQLHPSGFTLAMPLLVSSSADRSLVAPSAGTPSAFRLFNGAGATTRCACTIWYAAADARAGAFPWSAQWNLSEGRGKQTVAQSAGFGALTNSVHDLGLEARWLSSGFFPVLGPIPNSDPSSGFQWERILDWRRRTLPAKTWRRAA